MAKTTAKNTTQAARKSKKTADAPVIVQHAESLQLGGEDNLGESLESLLADLTGEPSGDLSLDADAMINGEAEIIEPAGLTEANPDDFDLSEEDVAHAVGHAEAVSAAIAVATPEGIATGAALPTGEEPDGEPLTAEDAVEASGTTPAATKTPRKHYSDKVERIKDRLGAAAADFTVLTLADAGVSDEELKQVMENTFDIIKGMNKKQKDHASLLFDFLSGKKAKMRNVHEIALRVLNRDGHITMGKASNLISEMLGKPYSMGSARAMSGNAVGMFHDLKLLVADGKGKFVGNPESMLLAAANAKLGLSTPAAATA